MSEPRCHVPVAPQVRAWNTGIGPTQNGDALMKRNLECAPVVVLCVLTATSTARADLPADRSVFYVMHAVPTDPASEATFIVKLDLRAVDQIGADVAWEVAAATFRESLTGGNENRWNITLPFVDTPDGLWWIEHADPDIPVRSEFTVPPTLLGLAIAEDPADPDLHFDVAGVLYVPPPEGAPYQTTASLSYAMRQDGDPDPDPVGDDEPVDVPDGVNDPTFAQN